MRVGLALFDYETVYLVSSELSMPPIEEIGRRTTSTALRPGRHCPRTTLTHTGSPWYSPFQMSVNP